MVPAKAAVVSAIPTVDVTPTFNPTYVRRCVQDGNGATPPAGSVHPLPRMHEAAATIISGGYTIPAIRGIEGA